MNTQEDNGGEWLPCAPGTLQAIGAQRKARRRRFLIARSAAAASVLGVVVLTGVLISQSLRMDQQYFYGGISCEEVQAQMDKYAMGALSADIASRINAHLQECPECQKMMQQMQNTQGSVSLEDDISKPGSPWQLVAELSVIAYGRERSMNGNGSQLASIAR